MAQTPEVGSKVAEIIMKLSLLAAGEGPFPFSLVIDDPAGNRCVSSSLERRRSSINPNAFVSALPLAPVATGSFVQNLVAPQQDPQIRARHYLRSPEQVRPLDPCLCADPLSLPHPPSL